MQNTVFDEISNTHFLNYHENEVVIRGISGFGLWISESKNKAKIFIFQEQIVFVLFCFVLFYFFKGQS